MSDRFPDTAGSTGLRGRARESAALDGLVAAIRRGESRSLVVRGEAGIGKTALLEHLIGSASDMTVVRAVGVESEMELAFAGLHQLCAPMLDRLSKLPVPQRHALEIVFGLNAGNAPDRFLVALAVLSLVSEVAEERPLLCVVDDAQWLDHASALTLTFVARRLLAEPVGIVFAAREPGEELQDVAQLEVHGLRNGDARALLGSAVRFMLDERVRDRIVAETRGNPLALLELPRGLTATSWPAASGCSASMRSRDASRRATFVDSTRWVRMRGACCWSRRPSRSEIRYSCCARPSDSGSPSMRSTRRRTACWWSVSA
jgi:AAA ATPase domain